MSVRALKKLLHIQLLCICLIGCSLSGLTACREANRTPRTYLIPDGYVGWVKIDFKVKDAPALRTEDGSYVLEFPPSGRLQTSSPNEYGPAIEEYFYYSGNERKPLKFTTWDGGGMIWGGFAGSKQGAEETYEGFFVGTEEQFKTFGANSRLELLDLP